MRVISRRQSILRDVLIAMRDRLVTAQWIGDRGRLLLDAFAVLEAKGALVMRGGILCNADSGTTMGLFEEIGIWSCTMADAYAIAGLTRLPPEARN